MKHRRAISIVLRLGVCIAAGFIINACIAIYLGLSVDSRGATQAWGFEDPKWGQCSLHWWVGWGSAGHGVIIMQYPFAGGPSLDEMHLRFREQYAAIRPPNFELYESRFFPAWLPLDHHASTKDMTRKVYASGWPALSMYGVEWRAMSDPSKARSAGLVFRDRGSAVRAVGVIPLVRGTIINTVVFSAPMVLLAFAVPASRHRRRRRRGHCPKCNYDLRHELSAGCPECGWSRSSANPADELVHSPDSA